jgi:hypothetical protein
MRVRVMFLIQAALTRRMLSSSTMKTLRISRQYTPYGANATFLRSYDRRFGPGDTGRLQCWRWPPELKARRRSATSPSHSLTNERRRGHEESTLSQPIRLLSAPSRLFLFGVYNQMRSYFPATPAHAASCPPLARERCSCVAWRECRWGAP